MKSVIKLACQVVLMSPLIVFSSDLSTAESSESTQQLLKELNSDGGKFAFVSSKPAINSAAPVVNTRAEISAPTFQYEGYVVPIVGPAGLPANSSYISLASANKPSDKPKVILGRATPIERRSTALTAEEERRIDAKFHLATPSPQNMKQAHEPKHTSESPVGNNIANSAGEMLVANNGNNTNCVKPASNNANYAVHVASYQQQNNVAKGWNIISNKYPDLLCQLSAKSNPVQVNGKRFYSLRVGPLESPRAAKILCEAIRNKGGYCTTSDYLGEQVR